MKSLLELTVTSAGEFLQQRPPLKIAVIIMDNEKALPCLAFERPVNDIELNKENIKELIKTLTELL
jgi:hypothetical protein